MRRRRSRGRRIGALVPLTAILMVVLLAMVAFTVDIGYIVLVRQELQNAADSAALAGAGKLYDLELQANFAPQGGLLLVDPAVAGATGEACLFTGKNTAGNLAVVVNNSDIIVGSCGGSSPLQILPPSAPGFLPNTVQVTVRRDATVSTGPLRLFFAPVLGHPTQDLQATATAASLGGNVVGFSAPSANANSPLLPIALDVNAWTALLSGTPLPSGYTKETVTLIAGMRTSGVVAPIALPGAVDGMVFQTYVQEALIPELQEGDVVVLDNLQAHKNQAAIAAIQAAGARVEPLPVYSPDLTPIEEMFSKTKTYLRKVAARTTDTVITAMGEALELVTPSDILGWFHDRCAYAMP